METPEEDSDWILEGDYLLESPYKSGPDSSSSSLYGRGERKDIATEILKGMISSGLVESPEDMAKEAVKIADALLAELNK
jgi:hypothetical protein